LFHFGEKVSVFILIRKEVKGYEEVDFSLARSGDDGQFCLYGSWLQTEDGDNENDDDDDQGGGKTC